MGRCRAQLTGTAVQHMSPTMQWDSKQTNIQKQRQNGEHEVPENSDRSLRSRQRKTISRTLSQTSNTCKEQVRKDPGGQKAEQRVRRPAESGNASITVAGVTTATEETIERAEHSRRAGNNGPPKSWTGLKEAGVDHVVRAKEMVRSWSRGRGQGATKCRA